MGTLLERNLRARGVDPTAVPRRTKLGRTVRAAGVRHTPEVDRILKIPRRQWWTDAITPAVVAEMTAAYRTPGGTWTLFPHQAWALLEAIDHRGHFGMLPVGSGKSLISALLPHTGPYRRPMLLQPSKLVAKTERDFAALSMHWRVAPVRIVSAQLLGSHTTGPALLETYMPDLIIIDEAHMFRNPDAARTRRLDAYIQKHRPVVLTMSGTYHEDSLHDYAHLLRWSLPPALRPLPEPADDGSDVELEDWSAAVDTDVPERLAPGALRAFTSAPRPGLTEIRNGLAERLRSTPGVIGHYDEGPGCSISLEADVFNDYGPAVDAAFETLALGETTDGWPVREAIVQYMHQWQYCLGYESYWDPRPPVEWSDALRQWGRQCRAVLAERIEGVDSPMLLARAIDRGEFDPGPLATWRAIRGTFTPNVKVRQIDDSVVQHVAKWLRTHPRGTVWTRHVPFGRRLSEVAGVPYFGAKGLDRNHTHIEQYRGGAAILSIDACRDGINIQDRYDCAYIVDPPGTGTANEQLIGRFHRRGQRSPEVSITYLMGCLSHYTSIARARERATNVSESALQSRKLLIGDWLIPSAGYFKSLDGPRWCAMTMDGRDTEALTRPDNGYTD